MKLKFLIGAAGAGKTYRCLDEMTAVLEQEGDLMLERPLYFLVPEQATFQMERALLKHRPNVTATSGARVLSFKRLAHLALQQTGPITRPHLGELGKLMALHVAIEREKDNLHVFTKAAQTEGFLEAIAATYTELRTHNQAIESFEQAALLMNEGDMSGTGDVLSQKLRDVAIIGRAYEETFLHRFQDGHEVFDLAVRVVRESGLFSGARLWIDGFAGFTPQEFELLKSLMGTCSEMTVALCLDPSIFMDTPVEQWEEGPADALFQLTRQTLVRLRDLAYAVGVTDIEWEALPATARGKSSGSAPRFASSPFLTELERALVVSDRGTKFTPGDISPEEIQAATLIVEAPHRQGEVEAAAKEIHRLVNEEGYRYREIAVIVRDMERYRTLIQASFNRWGIPFFLDHKPSAHHHPVVTLVTAALDMCRHGIRTESLFRFLKTDLLPLSREDIDALENVAISQGIEGREWWLDDVWEYISFDTEQRAGIEMLFAFVEQVSKGDGTDYLQALIKLLSDLNVAETLARWSEEAQAAQDTLSAGEHEQVWEGLLHVLEQISEVLGDEPLSLDEFITVVNSGLQRIQLGRVPPHIDQVLVGSVERSRQPELACTIILGLNDGLFPGIPQEDPVFSDDDRMRLTAVGIELGPGSRERLHHEKYLLYVALTRASRRIVLTYSRSDDSGRPLRPSAIIGWMARHYPQVPIVNMTTRPTEEEWPRHTGELWGWLARTCRDVCDGGPISPSQMDRILAIYDWALNQPELESNWADPLSSLVYENVSERISPDSIEALYGAALSTSPSGLENLLGCSFKYFAGYGLRLKDRERARADAATWGTFVHGVLSRFVRSLQEDDMDWAELSRQESDERVLKIVEEELRHSDHHSIMKRAVNRYIIRRLTSTLRDAVWALGEHCRSGEFRPYAVEIEFGPKAAIPPVRLTTPSGFEVIVRGRIDRVDTAEHGGRRWFRIIDYKSSKRTFRWSRVVHGVDLQLSVYMLAAAEALRADAIDPAGCFYIPVFDPVISVDAPPSVGDERWRKELKATGFIVDDGQGVPRLMDREASGYSDLVPLYFKKDGTLGSASQTIDDRQLDQLLTYTKKMVGEKVDQLVAGNTDISPYEAGQTSACAFCAFKPVCQFDPSLPSNTYRRLPSLSNDEAWSIMSGQTDPPESVWGDDAHVS